MRKLIPVLLPLLCSAAWAQSPPTPGAPDNPPAWRSAGSAQYACGGVSDEAMDALSAEKGKANGALLFTAGPNGAYVANVRVSLKGATVPQAIEFTSSGTACLLSLPAGTYTVDAEYNGIKRSATLKTASPPAQVKMNWPASPAP